MHMRWMHSLLILFLLLCSCAPIKPITSDQYDRIKNIGVVSLVGTKLQINYIGPTIFNDSQNELDIDWSINKYISDTIKQELDNSTKFHFVDVNYRQEDLDKVHEAHKGLTGSYQNISPIKEDLRKIIKEYSLDALFLVVRMQTSDSNLYYVDGFGVLERNILIYKECYSHLFALVLLVDNVNIEPVTHFSIYKYRKLDSSCCPGSKATLNKEQYTLVIDWVKTEILKNIPNGLVLMGLKRQQ
jgi:hypothetical protein